MAEERGTVKGRQDDAATAQLLALSADEPESDIGLFVNSPGGSVLAGLAVYDVMQLIPNVVAAALPVAAIAALQALRDRGRPGPGQSVRVNGASGGVGTFAALQALLSGCDPVTGATLGQPLVDRTLSNGKVIRAVSGFDATLSVPKSLSVLWALTGDEGFAECHDVAVRTVAGYLERFGVTTRVRSNGMRMHLDTHGLTMAAFRQTTSRPTTRSCTPPS